MAQEDRSTHDPKTGQKTGSIAFGGKIPPTASTVVPIYRKGEMTDHAKNVEALEKAFKEVGGAAEKGDKKAMAEYDRAQKKLDDALMALLPETIAGLKIGDRVDHIHLLSGNPEWDGTRAEARLYGSLVSEELLARFRKGFEVQEPKTPGDPAITMTLLSISPTMSEDEPSAEVKTTIITGYEWEGKYQPITNHFDPDTSWNGTVFETYGEELDFVMAQDPNLVWTWVMEGDESTLLSGFHNVNRMGYFICKIPFDATQGHIAVDIG
jgi:hypothetical protein